jgi:predicted nucleotidyltransferase
MAIDFETVILIVEKYAKEVRNVFSVDKIFLFGSYAKGTANEYSDVDVCFFLNDLDNSNYLKTISQLLSMANNYMEIDIEPIAMHVSDLDDNNPFANEVLRTGIEIK